MNNAEERNWADDWPYAKTSYTLICEKCKQSFFGQVKRNVCRVCNSEKKKTKRKTII
jgi:hypothetical protein